jgi:hypothetical protein
LDFKSINLIEINSFPSQQCGSQGVIYFRENYAVFALVFSLI